MDIGQMARPLIGDARAQPQDTRALELRSGQVVRGVVLQVLDDQEALVSINGTPVKARLETPLQPGQASWMQVQPESSAEAGLVLKMVRAGPRTGDEAIARQLQELGLKDTPLNRELLRQVADMGIELHGKDARALAAFLSRHDAPIDSARWIQSALIVSQRGLPLTMETVRSVAEAVYGRPLPQQLSSLMTQLQQLASTAQSELSEAAKQLIGKLIDSLGNWLSVASGREAAGWQRGPVAGSGLAGSAQPAAAQADAAGAASAGTRPPAAGSPIAGASPSLPTAATGEQGEAAHTAFRQSLPGAAALAEGGSPHGQQHMARSGDSATATTGQQAAGAQPSISEQASGVRTPQAAAAVSRANGALIRSLLHFLGLGHEHQLLKTLVLKQPGASMNPEAGQHVPQGSAQPGPQSATSGGQQPAVPSSSLQQVQPPGAQSAWMPGTPTPGMQPAQQPTQQPAAPNPLPGSPFLPPSPTSAVEQLGAQPAMQPGAQAVQQSGLLFPQPSGMVLSQQPLLSSDGAASQPTVPETIKGLLLQAANSEHLPQAVRETIQQAVQSITGQQLLMSADRSAPVTYITMFVPFMNEQGEHLASVHIQTRKGRRGGLDMNNCHLLFDLRMSALGEMMIDVQVTERIVSLQIYNDHPLMKYLAEEGKQGLQQALADMGYRLSMVKVTALPEPAVADPSRDSSAEAPQSPVRELRKYTAGSTYKGVDLRI